MQGVKKVAVLTTVRSYIFHLIWGRKVHSVVGDGPVGKSESAVIRYAVIKLNERQRLEKPLTSC